MTSNRIDPERPEDSEFNSRELLNRLADEDSQAAKTCFDRYVKRLLALASSRISAKLRPRFDEQDVVQSAMNSFFKGAIDRQFVLEETGDLWRLLATITLRKVYQKTAEHSAQRRDYRREVNQASTTSEVGVNSLDFIPVPTNQEADSLLDELESQLGSLSKRDRQIFLAKLEGKSLKNIADELKCNERTIRRALKRIQNQFNNCSLDADGHVDPHTLNWSEIILKQHVGSGGIGKVYRAEILQTGATVAVKSLRKSLQNDRTAIRILRNEASTLKSIDHPNIVKFIGTGQFPKGGIFLAMQWIDGTDQQRIINQDKISGTQLSLRHIAKTISMFREFANAVEYLHQNGIVHCDIKPANFLVSQQGKVYLADFGFARLFRQSGFSTATGGTPQYMAPEQKNNSESVSPATDIYGLGCLLHAMLFREPPIGEIQTGSMLPSGLTTTIQKCVSARSCDRF